jgi:hypothetical protein
MAGWYVCTLGMTFGLASAQGRMLGSDTVVLSHKVYIRGWS